MNDSADIFDSYLFSLVTNKPKNVQPVEALSSQLGVYNGSEIAVRQSMLGFDADVVHYYSEDGSLARRMAHFESSSDDEHRELSRVLHERISERLGDPNLDAVSSESITVSAWSRGSGFLFHVEANPLDPDNLRQGLIIEYESHLL